MGLHTTKVAVGEGKFALEEALEVPSIRAALAMRQRDSPFVTFHTLETCKFFKFLR